MCAFGAAAIHFGFAPDHFGESRFHGAFFFLAGWAQLAFGLAVILRPSRAVLRAGILLKSGSWCCGRCRASRACRSATTRGSRSR